MKRCGSVFFLVFMLLAAGCAVRSISDSGYRKESAPGAARQAASPFYGSELDL